VSALAERLQGRDATVLITGEADAPLQAALATLDAARAAGIEDVQLELMP
jgi:biopolymer transport protein ExbD